jgi:hypothetical protein
MVGWGSRACGNSYSSIRTCACVYVYVHMYMDMYVYMYVSGVWSGGARERVATATVPGIRQRRPFRHTPVCTKPLYVL